MKKISLFLLLCIFIPNIIKAETKYFYDLFKEENDNNGLVKEYTGEHKDSLNQDNDYKIYHYFSNNSDETNLIKNKNNVIFGGLCWKMFRTTDTGGVKLLYNGFPKNNNCSDYYGADVSINNVIHVSVQDYYYFSTDFDVDEDKYIIPKGDVKQGSELDSYVGRFMFQITNNNSKTRDAYYMISNNLGIAFYSRSGDNHTLGVVDNSENLPNSLSNIGYKKGKDYKINKKNISSSKSYYSVVKMNGFNKYGSIPTIKNNKFELEDEKEITSSNKNQMKGYYILNYNNELCYVVGYINNDSYKVITFNKNDGIPNIGEYFLFGSSYIENPDGTYTLQNTNSIGIEKLETQYANMLNKYTCFSSNENCEKIIYITSVRNSYYTYLDGNIKFYKNVNYENGHYILSNDYIKSETMNENLAAFNNYHYFKDNNNDNEISFVYYIENKTLYYITFNNGDNYTNMINNITTQNTNDSLIKTELDIWFKHYLLDYKEYLEDIIYCNNREIENYGGLSETGDLSSEIIMKVDTSLKCNKITDSFSVSNNQAKLEYPTGFITKLEMNLLGNYSLSFDNIRPMTNSIIKPYVYMYNEKNINPVISLKKDSFFSSGDGSESNPYIYEGISTRNKINIIIKNETKDLDININDLAQVENGETVNFKVIPIKGYKINSIKILDTNNNEIEYLKTANENEYSFSMPSGDVTIEPSYEKVTNSVLIEDNPNTKEIIIEIENSQAVIYEDTVLFKVTPKDGYEIDYIDIVDQYNNKIDYNKSTNEYEYEFSMPDTNVTIKPFYKKIALDKEKIINPKTGDNNYYYSVILVLIIICSLFIVKKKNTMI